MISPELNPEVRNAIASGEPVVALESTVISHGLPYPENLRTAHAMEEIIRKSGAVPATIAVVSGCLRVGLEARELELFARTDGISKLSRNSLAHCLVTGGNGSLTVAATMIAAHLSGIQVFATGGIGGVHKGGSETFDVSADLHELAKTAVTVVSAGAKAILDIAMTLEVLESLGVPVLVFGADEFPAFWSKSSGIPAPLRVDSVEDIATMHRKRNSLGLTGGQLIANPILESDEIPREIIEPAVESATRDARKLGVRSKELTPFLLQRVLEATEGRSLCANVALLKNNAKLAAKIAISISQLENAPSEVSMGQAIR